ncbi:PREDICTED: uncharacterized protein CG3556-like [Polistes canadensis]|uniref:uncharacterized protein CG3556-like n=1 Tax=Polistes canadensis TaxID=91411 RepID=UPI000718F5FA|nr:PREDICTED: uncharacterized protein CG3556-like [Polistes canadensis]
MSSRINMAAVIIFFVWLFIFVSCNNLVTSENHIQTITTTTSESSNSNTNTIINCSSVPIMVNVSYTLWVGDKVDETYNLTVSATKNETFFEVMISAAEMSTHFLFIATVHPVYGYYIHTLNGIQENRITSCYWMLYQLPTLPDPTSPPGDQWLTTKGVGDVRVDEGDYFLFWYKYVNIKKKSLLDY